MTPFTDDDIKRWKEWWEHKAPGSACDCMTYEMAQALLARLEAAEVLAECLSNHDDLDPVEVTQIGVWRKAAGG